MVDAGDSKSPAARRAGSIPAPGTTDQAGSFPLPAFSFLWTLAARAGLFAMTTTAQDLIAFATVWAYRLAAYALENLAEDAALLAMVFC